MYDIHKAYNSVFTGDAEKHARRLVWRWGREDDEWTTFGFVKMHFGDQPAATGLEVAKEIAAEEGRSIDEDTASKMKKGGYVDDHIVGGSKAECANMRRKCSIENGEYHYDGTIAKILAQVGMKPKVIVSNKDEDDIAISKLGDTFLGYKWNVKEDVIGIKFNGIRAKPSIKMETINELESTGLTLRIVTGVLASQYDPLGLNSPRTIKYKILLKETNLVIKDWDQLFENELLKKWREALKEMVKSKVIEFPRAAIEEGCIDIELIGYWDGSKSAYAAVLYLRCKNENCEEIGGCSWAIKILTGKARVTPAKGLTPPRSELNGLLILCRLISACREGLPRVPDRITLIGDSECTISSVESEEGILAPYFAKRCEEIDEHMSKWKQVSVVDPLYHTP